MLNIEIDNREMVKFAHKMSLIPKKFESAKIRALNNTASGLKTESSKIIRSKFAVKTRDVKKRANVVKATQNRDVAMLNFKGKSSVKLSKYKIKSSEFKVGKTLVRKKRAKRGNEKVVIYKDRGVKQVKGAFLAQMKSGHIGFFKRVGKKLKMLYSISFLKSLEQERNIEPLKIEASKRLKKEMTRSTSYELYRAGLI